MTHKTSASTPIAPAGTPGSLAVPDIAFGANAGLGFRGLCDGLALVGPSQARRRVIRSLVDDALRAGAGIVVLATDPAPALPDAVAALAERHGRGDATRIVDAEAAPDLSHRLGAFEALPAAALLRLALACSPDLAGPGAEAGRARRLLTACLDAMASFRDQGLLDLGPRAVLDHLQIRWMINLTDRDAFPQLPDDLRRSVSRFLDGLPGYEEQRKYKQVPSAMEAYARAADVASDALAWMDPARYGALTATAGHDLAIPDLLAPGRAAMMRATALPGQHQAAAFLAGCVREGIALRTGDAPAIVVIDGADDLPPRLVREFATLRGPNLGIVLGLAQATAETAPAARECLWRAHLAGADPDAGAALGLRDPDRRLPGADGARLGRPGSYWDIDLPEAVVDPARGPVTRFGKVEAPAPEGGEAVTAVLRGARTPEPAPLGDVVADLAGTMGEGHEATARAYRAIAADAPGPL